MKKDKPALGDVIEKKHQKQEGKDGFSFSKNSKRKRAHLH